MFEAFVITLREGVEAALVVCVLLAYLDKTDRPALRRPVLWGFAAAVGASAGIGALLLALRVDPENETLEGILFLVSAVFVASMAIWMWRHARTMKREIEARVERLAATPAASAGLFLFTFLMVGREGVETVLFLAATTLSSEAVWTLLGGLAGIGVAIALGVSFFRGSRRIDLRRFFGVTTAMLLVFVVQLLVGAFHEFLEAGVIRPADPAAAMAVVGPLVRQSALFILAIIALPFALVAWQALRPPEPAPPAANPAEERKERAMTRSERTGRAAFSLLAVVAILAIGGRFLYARRGLELSPTAMLEARDGAVRVDAAGLPEAQLARYGLLSDDRVIRFLAYRVGDDVRTVFDACAICQDQGYVQQGESLICRNCLAEIYAPTLGFEGGCNPIPLRSAREGPFVVVRLSDLEARRDAFAKLPEGRCAHCGMTIKLVSPSQTTCDMPECRAQEGR